MVQIGAQGLLGVEIALRQPMQPSGGGRKGVQQGDLDQIESSLAGLDETARLADMQPHPRQAVGTAGKGTELILHQRHHLRVQLHGVHRPGAKGQRLEHVGPAARPQDQHPGLPQQMIGQGRGQEIQVGLIFPVAIEAVDGGHAVPIGEEGYLGRRFGLGQQTEAWRMAEGHPGTLDRRDHPQGAGNLGDHPRATDLQSLGQFLVGRGLEEGPGPR